MKKVIFIPQPFAAMAVAKLLPGVPLETRPSENRERFLVYATKQVKNPKMPIEWIREAHNQQVFGNIPTADKLAENAIVGYVDVKSDPFIDTSIWGRWYKGQLFRVVHARIFDTPLCLPLEALDNHVIEQLLATLPVYSLAMPNEPFAFGKELEVPVNEVLFRKAAHGCKITLDITSVLSHRVLDEQGELRKFDSLSLTCGNRRRYFEFSGEVTTELNDDFEAVLYPSVSQCCGSDIRNQLELFCGLSPR